LTIGSSTKEKRSLKVSDIEILRILKEIIFTLASIRQQNKETKIVSVVVVVVVVVVVLLLSS